MSAKTRARARVFCCVGVYILCTKVYIYLMETSTDTRSHAAILVDEMIVAATARIVDANTLLDQALVTLEQRTGKAQLDLLGGLGIAQGGIAEAAHRVENAIGERDAAYRDLRSLQHVRKAC